MWPLSHPFPHLAIWFPHGKVIVIVPLGIADVGELRDGVHGHDDAITPCYVVEHILSQFIILHYHD